MSSFTRIAIYVPSMDTAHSSLDNKLRLDDWYLELSQNTVLAVVQSIDQSLNKSILTQSCSEPLDKSVKGIWLGSCLNLLWHDSDVISVRDTRSGASGRQVIR